MAHKIQIAVKARIPIITCTTRDVANLQPVLEHLLPEGKHIEQYVSNAPMKPNSVYWVVGGALGNTPDSVEFRNKLFEKKSSFLLVNPADGHSHDISVSVGMLPVPQDMMANMLAKVVKDEDTVKAAVAALGGVTIKEGFEIALYSMAEHKSLTPGGLALSRNELFKPQKGLYPVDTAQDFYEPGPDLKKWINREKKFFLWENDPRLVPRGLMLDGRPGTGKSEAAKYIARMFEVPLYRLDLSTTQDKYVGNSAKFLQANLDMLDQQEPCVVLIDEVEKVVGGSTNTYVTELLSMMLWWMQTHKSKVLTICTTNDLSKLPKEFYRPGRIDEVITVNGLSAKELEGFLKSLLKVYGHANNDIMFTRVFEELTDEAKGNLIPAARVENAVKKAVKALAQPKKKLVFKGKTL